VVVAAHASQERAKELVWLAVDGVRDCRSCHSHVLGLAAS
jgi:hypothetical protein